MGERAVLNFGMDFALFAKGRGSVAWTFEGVATKERKGRKKWAAAGNEFGRLGSNPRKKHENLPEIRRP
jgi:hypothetical protein